ncbi:MAG: carbohydrate kinase family protein [Clostridia bacterium]|nr:carbohydrate kinase family protein [Clostridia bacterium]
MRKGIAVAGTVLADKINVIKAYPKAGELTQIKSVSLSVGGLVPNVGIDLKKIDPDCTVYACCKVGCDGEGEFIKSELGKNGLDLSGLKTSETERTSFTDVMSIAGGERTFFTYAGACAEFGEKDVDLDLINAEMLHLGYFLLLDKIDGGDGEKILKKAKEKGVKTSIDLVSENSDRYSLVIPCLKYTDNLIVNEIEAGKLAGIEPKKENVRKICETLKRLGVSERVIIHMPEFCACAGKDGYIEMPSLELPGGYIKGATGAGDAFCAGVLYGIYKGFTDKEILEFSTQTAAVSLKTADAVSGLMTESDIREFCKVFGRKKI